LGARGAGETKHHDPYENSKRAHYLQPPPFISLY
jgi:hypothetical protein